MSGAQKIIKYLAIAFAILLIFNIISGIMYGIISFTNIFNNNEIQQEIEELSINENIQIIDIEVSSINIIIKEGENFKAETNNKNITYKQVNNKLSISEKNHNWFTKNNTTDLIIYIPSNHLFENVSIENGAGKIEIENINTQKLDLDLGAGKVDINKLTVLDKTKIEGGAGEIIISNANINNLDLDSGVGRLSLTSQLTGNNEINAGVGEIELNLIGNEADYKIKVEEGLGTTKLNGNNINDKTYYGTGSNIVDIEGGIGSININYTE